MHVGYIQNEKISFATVLLSGFCAFYCTQFSCEMRPIGSLKFDLWARDSAWNLAFVFKFNVFGGFSFFFLFHHWFHHSPLPLALFIWHKLSIQLIWLLLLYFFIQPSSNGFIFDRLSILDQAIQWIVSMCCVSGCDIWHIRQLLSSLSSHVHTFSMLLFSDS